MAKLKNFEAEMEQQADGHVYSKKTGKRLHSPSWLIRPLFNLKVEKIPKWVMETTRARGKDVGEAIEVFETIGEWHLDNPDHQNYIEAYKKWKETYEPKVLANEYHVCDHKNSTHGFIDLMIDLKGKTVAVEIKTRGKAEIRNTDLIQNYIYHRPLGIPFYILILMSNGNYHFEKMEFTQNIKNQTIVLKEFRKMIGGNIAGDERKR